jgi:hypothetical protein
VAEEQLVLLPWVYGAACGNLPDHSKNMKDFFNLISGEITNMVQKLHPSDYGLIRVRVASRSGTES